MENTDQVNNENNDNMSKIELGANNNSRTIIIILGVLLILSLLGVNFFLMIGTVLDKFFSGLQYYLLQLMTSMGFYGGAVINTTADIVGDTAKTGIDIAEGTVQSVGNLLQNRPNMGGTTLEQQQWNTNVFGLNPTPMGEDNQEYSSLQHQINTINQKMDPPPSSNVDHNNKLQNINEKVTQFANKIEDKKGLLLELDNEINVRQKSLNTLPTNNSDVQWCPIGNDKTQGLCMQIGKNDKCMYGKTFNSKEQCEETISADSSNSIKKYDNSHFSNWGPSMRPPPPGALAPPNQPLPGMCLQQKPMCGQMKQMPLQSMPSRGQIQQGLPPVSQQQQQQQMGQQQPQMGQQQQPMPIPQANSPPASNTTPSINTQNSPSPSDQYNPNMNNVNYQSFSPAPSSAPIDYSGMIVPPAASPSTNPQTSTQYSPSYTNGSTPSTDIKIQLSDNGIFIPEKALDKFGKYMGQDENVVPNTHSPSSHVSSPGSMIDGHLNTSISNLTTAINKNTLSRDEMEKISVATPAISNMSSTITTPLPSTSFPPPSTTTP